MTLMKLSATLGLYCFFSLTWMVVAGEETTLWRGELTKKSKALKGSVRFVSANGNRFIVFGDNFKTKNGPDLKVVLSPLSFDEVTGKNAMRGAKVVALLQAVSGSQRYTIPPEIDLDGMKSLLIHCEKYSVLWGGVSLTSLDNIPQPE